jgi:hypothetical protein
MTLKFQYVFTGKRVRAMEEHGDAFINIALRPSKGAVVSVTRGWAIPYHGFSDLSTGGTRDANDADAAAPRGGGQRRDGVGGIKAFDHDVSLREGGNSNLSTLV